jgi:hypothetical protein
VIVSDPASLVSVPAFDVRDRKPIDLRRGFEVHSQGKMSDPFRDREKWCAGDKRYQKYADNADSATHGKSESGRVTGQELKTGRSESDVKVGQKRMGFRTISQIILPRFPLPR